MRKPSIFSRDYERLMKKRRKRILITSFSIFIFILIIVSLVFKNIFYNNAKYRGIVDLITSKENNEEKDIVINENIEQVQKELEDLSEIYTIEKNLNGIKVILEIESNSDKITEIYCNTNNIYTLVNKDYNLALVIDKNQNMSVLDNCGNVIDVTLEKYISPENETFEKDDILNYYEGYLWHSEARFLSENKVIYISNIPYFGYNLKKYLTIVDTKTLEHKTIWETKADDIIFDKITNLGLGVIIDGNIKNINSDGNIY